MSSDKVEMYSPTYFGLCALGGVMSCGLTHAAMTPVDLVKCNAQSNPQLFNKGMIGNMKIIIEGRGVSGLMRGWSPTLVGYSLQGAGKFGLYELFKYNFAQALGEENAAKYKTLMFMAASASAEFFADLLLCPWEVLKLKVQTVDIAPWVKGESNGYAKSELVGGFSKLMATEGIAGAYSIIGALWGRQIPYTVIKFVAFEAIVTSLYSAAEEQWGKTKADMNKFEQLGFTLTAGYSAGVLCGAVSHPADTMASLLSKNADMPGGAMDKVKTLYTKGYGDTPALGFKGLWGGFAPRVFMIGTLTALQWLVYDGVKVTFGIPTTGGK